MVINSKSDLQDFSLFAIVVLSLYDIIVGKKCNPINKFKHILQKDISRRGFPSLHDLIDPEIFSCFGKLISRSFSLLAKEQPIMKIKGGVCNWNFFKKTFNIEDEFVIENNIFYPEFPWNQLYEEGEEINEIHLQDLIALFYKSTGANVTNIHKTGRQFESGIDLLVEAENKRIGIAVKIKPRSRDRGQLYDLIRRKDLDEKIFVYFKEPTSKFKEIINDSKNEILFLSRRELEKHLYNLNKSFYFTLVIENSELFNCLLELRDLILSDYLLIKENRKFPGKKIENVKDILDILWRMKDDIVAMHKTFMSLYQILENIVNQTQGINSDKFLNDRTGALTSLVKNLFYPEVSNYPENLGGDMHNYCKRFIENYKKLRRKHFDTLMKSYKKIELRSVWDYIAKFYAYLNFKFGGKSSIDRLLNDFNYLSKSITKVVRDYINIVVSYLENIEYIIDSIHDYVVDEITSS